MIDKQVTSATADVSGGAQVFVRSSDGKSDLAGGADPHSRRLDGRRRCHRSKRASPLENSTDDHFWSLTAFDDSLVQMEPPTLQDRGAYATNREAWLAVLSDPGLIIADPEFLHQGGPPGFDVKVGDRLTSSTLAPAARGT